MSEPQGKTHLTHRQCTIEIDNNCKSHTLLKPRVYLKSGYCSKPLSPTIESGKKGDAIFIKRAYSAKGAVGVFTYDLLNTKNQHTKKMAVMFSVPFDFNVFNNWYGVGIFEDEKRCDRDLYYEMYYNKDNNFVRHKAKDPSICYRDNHVTVRATMSDYHVPVMKVEVSDNE